MSKTNQITLCLASSQTPHTHTQRDTISTPSSPRTTKQPTFGKTMTKTITTCITKSSNHRPQKPQWQGRKLLNDRPDFVLVALPSSYHLILIKILCSPHYYPHEEIAAQGGNLPKAPSYKAVESIFEWRSGSGLKWGIKSPPLTPFLVWIYLLCIRITWPVYVKCIFYPPPPDILHWRVMSEGWNRILNKYLRRFWCRWPPTHTHRVLALYAIKLELAKRETASLPLERLCLHGKCSEVVQRM